MCSVPTKYGLYSFAFDLKDKREWVGGEKQTPKSFTTISTSIATSWVVGENTLGTTEPITTLKIGTKAPYRTLCIISYSSCRYSGGKKLEEKYNYHSYSSALCKAQRKNTGLGSRCTDRHSMHSSFWEAWHISNDNNVCPEAEYG